MAATSTAMTSDALQAKMGQAPAERQTHLLGLIIQLPLLTRRQVLCRRAAPFCSQHRLPIVGKLQHVLTGVCLSEAVANTQCGTEVRCNWAFGDRQGLILSVRPTHACDAETIVICP